MGHHQTDSGLDTICSLATAIGRSGIGIIRVSGVKVHAISQRILNTNLVPRKARLLNFYNQKGEVLDRGIALFFSAPNSFTGEDILELQAHGGPVLLDMLIKEILALGARQARPGEFSERAFLNGKLDLAQAESIADLIDAASTQAVKSAGKSLQGEFSNKVNKLLVELINLRTFIEAAIDFPDEEIDFIKNSDVSEHLLSLLQGLDQILQTAKTGNLLREGMNLVIAGKPNVGKSSLLNCLSGKNSAIVTDIPGTTRDVLKEFIEIDGMPLHILDTAGLRKTKDKIEQEGVRRAEAEIARADGVLLVIDDSIGLGKEDFNLIERVKDKLPLILVFNKADKTNKKPGPSSHDDLPAITICAKNCLGLDSLKQKLKELMGYSEAGEGVFMARRRHLVALNQAREFILNGMNQFKTAQAGELLAEDLRAAQQALGEITGKFGADELLGKIFSEFCIGK